MHARRVLSIYTCMIVILRETRTTVREWACCICHGPFMCLVSSVKMKGDCFISIDELFTSTV